MHTVHHTDAFIVKSQPAGEANRRIWLFTRDFGLVVAMVQGVRKQGAKLQMQLSDYSLASVDLVKGKEVWRLVSASLESAPLMQEPRAPFARGFVRTLSAVERFCQGEDPHPELFDHLRECLEALNRGEGEAGAYDSLSLWKVMVLLGYVAVLEEDEALYRAPLADAVRAIDAATKRRIVQEVNETIKQTHL